MSVWDRPDDRSAIRLFAVLLLLDRADRALAGTPRTAGDSPQAEGGRPAGRPPAPVALLPSAAPSEGEVMSSRVAGRMESVRELALLLKRDSQLACTGADMRRIAELLELLELEEEARYWWMEAARMGDEDAVDYLEILDTEGTSAKVNCGTDVKETNADPCARRRLGGGSAPLRSSETGVSGDRLPVPVPRLVVWEGRESSPEDAQRLLREIEDYLTHPDQVTDGGRC